MKAGIGTLTKKGNIMIITLIILVIITFSMAFVVLYSSVLSKKANNILQEFKMERKYENMAYEYVLKGEESIYQMDLSEDRRRVSIIVNDKKRTYELDANGRIIVIRKVRSYE